MDSAWSTLAEWFCLSPEALPLYSFSSAAWDPSFSSYFRKMRSARVGLVALLWLVCRSLEEQFSRWNRVSFFETCDLSCLSSPASLPTLASKLFRLAWFSFFLRVYASSASLYVALSALSSLICGASLAFLSLMLLLMSCTKPEIFSSWADFISSTSDFATLTSPICLAVRLSSELPSEPAPSALNRRPCVLSKTSISALSSVAEALSCWYRLVSLFTSLFSDSTSSGVRSSSPSLLRGSPCDNLSSYSIASFSFFCDRVSTVPSRSILFLSTIDAICLCCTSCRSPAFLLMLSLCFSSNALMSCCFSWLLLCSSCSLRSVQPSFCVLS